MANVIVFGDSIPFGFYDSKGGWVTRLITHFSSIEPAEKEIHTKIYNMAVIGTISTDIVAQIDTILKHRSWESDQTIVIFQFGINDSVINPNTNKATTPIEIFEANLSKLASVYNKYTKDIIFLGLTQVNERFTTPVPWDDKIYYKNESILLYNQAITKFAKEHSLTFVDLQKAFSNNTDELLVDGLHPSTKGHQLLFDIMLATLNEKIEK